MIITTPRCGVSDWQPRSDIAAHSIAVHLPKIEKRRPAAELWAEFEAARPALLAALYSALSQQWNRPPGLFPPCDLHDASAVADPAFTAIQTFAQLHPNWTGTETDLPICDFLTPRALSQRLRQLQPALSNQGIKIEFQRKPGGTRVWIPSPDSPPPASSPP